MGSPARGSWRRDDAGCDAPGGGRRDEPSHRMTGDGYARLRDPARGRRPCPGARAAHPSDVGPRTHGIACGGELVLEDRATGKATRLGQRRRPVLFTHHGLSSRRHGPLPPRVRAVGESPIAMAVRLDAFPDLDREAVRASLIEASGPRQPHIRSGAGGTPRGRCPSGSSAFASASGLDPDVGVAGREERLPARRVLQGARDPGGRDARFEHGGDWGTLALRQVNRDRWP